MELHRSNVIKMAEQGEQAPALFVVPNFDSVVIAARDEKRLHFVKVDAADRAIVLLEFVDDRLADVVIQLDLTVMQRGEDPGPRRVKS